MRSSAPLAALIAALAALLPKSTALAQGPPPGLQSPRAVLTEKDAFAILPPEIIAAPQVNNISSSESGRYILAERTSMRITQQMLKERENMHGGPPGEVSLILWDSQSRQAREVWKAASSTTRVVRTAWIPQTETALVMVEQNLPPDPKQPRTSSARRQGMLRVTPSMEKAQVIGLTELGEDGYLDFWVSPARPVAVLKYTRNIPMKTTLPNGTNVDAVDFHETLYMLSETGRLGAHVEMPKGLNFAGFQVGEDGNPAVLLVKYVPDKKGVERQWFAMNPRTAALTPLAKAPEFKVTPRLPSGSPTAAIRVRQTGMIAKEGETSQQVGLLWLESIAKSERPRALISSDSTGGFLLPQADVVVYHSQGALLAAPLLKMDKAIYLSMLEAAEQTTIMSNAKQLGLAVLMYSQDYDETMPTPVGINAKLEPYLKNDSLFQNFTYTYGGGKLADIKSPVETETGYVTGPGGRAVIYVDGHVKWRKD